MEKFALCVVNTAHFLSQKEYYRLSKFMLLLGIGEMNLYPFEGEWFSI